ncbi:MAG TPA: TlpA disulfide reductase family protein, partial [Micavibrio sp.]
MAWSSSLAKKLAIAIAAIAAAGLLAFMISRVANDGKAGNAEYTALPRPDNEFAAQFKLFYPFTEARGLAPMTFRDADGKTVSADDFKGRFILLHFWATWCAPCARELPLLDRFQTEIAGKKLVILPVSADFDMPAAKISEFMKKNNANNLPVLIGVQ